MQIFILLLVGVFLSSQSYSADIPEQLFGVNPHENVLVLGSENVDVHVGFHGQSIKVYGTKDIAQNVVLTVRGPSHDMRVARKEKRFGAWVNGDEKQFDQVPLFYRLASSAPMFRDGNEVVPQMGLGSLVILEDSGKPDASEVFYQALLRDRIAHNYFSNIIQNIDFIGDYFFVAEFYLPSNSPIGTYVVDGYFYNENGAIASVQRREFQIARVGFSASLKRLSQTFPFLYGVICVLLAISLGWVSNRLKRAF